jgi:hypothetical protein
VTFPAGYVSFHALPAGFAPRNLSHMVTHLTMKPESAGPVTNGNQGAGGPAREVHCADAIAWIERRGAIAGACAITSLPDVSELRLPLAEWRTWFIRAVQLTLQSVADSSAAIFFQSDIKRDGRWIDKGALVIRAAEDVGAHALFHKVICRREPGMLTRGRPGYTHLIAVSRAMACPDELPIPDVIVDAGRSPWVRAMGVRAAAHAVRFARNHVGATTIFDPFCGVGTVLAVANALGLDAIGVERSTRRSEQARVLRVNQAELEVVASNVRPNLTSRARQSGDFC